MADHNHGWYATCTYLTHPTDTPHIVHYGSLQTPVLQTPVLQTPVPLIARLEYHVLTHQPGLMIVPVLINIY